MADRVETGALAFGTDWPGAFIRGDNAKNYELHLAALLDYCEKQLQALPELGEEEAMRLVNVRVLRGLQDVLASSDVGNEAIVQHVKDWTECRRANSS